MSSTSAPFGIQAVSHTSGVIRPKAYPGVVVNSGQTLYSGAPIVIVQGTQTIQLVDANSSPTLVKATCLGIFQGIEYNDATGKRTFSNFFVGGTSVHSTNPNIIAYIMDDWNTTFRVQADGSVAVTKRGQQFSFTNLTAGSSTTGLSAATLSATAVSAGAGVYGHFMITGLADIPNNSWGDTYTVVEGRLVAPQFGPAMQLAI